MSFQAIGTGLGILGFHPCRCASPFPFALHISVFFHSLFISERKTSQPYELGSSEFHACELPITPRTHPMMFVHRGQSAHLHRRMVRADFRFCEHWAMMKKLECCIIKAYKDWWFDCNWVVWSHSPHQLSVMIFCFSSRCSFFGCLVFSRCDLSSSVVMHSMTIDGTQCTSGVALIIWNRGLMTAQNLQVITSVLFILQGGWGIYYRPIYASVFQVFVQRTLTSSDELKRFQFCVFFGFGCMIIFIVCLNLNFFMCVCTTLISFFNSFITKIYVPRHQDFFSKAKI